MHGIAVLDRRPLLPADVRAAFNAWCLDRDADAPPQPPQSQETLPSCCVVIASTGPGCCPAERAARPGAGARDLWLVRDRRATACDEPRARRAWRPLDGVQVEFASPVKLLDELLLDADFTLLGEQADLVQIAGGPQPAAAGAASSILPASDGPTKQLSGRACPRPFPGAALAARRVDPVFLPRSFIRLQASAAQQRQAAPQRGARPRVRDWQAAARSQPAPPPLAFGPPLGGAASRAAPCRSPLRTAMKSWKAKAVAARDQPLRSAWPPSPAGRALLYPIVLAVLTDRTARTASREFIAAAPGPAHRLERLRARSFAATLLDQRLHGPPRGDGRGGRSFARHSSRARAAPPRLASPST